jgi:putative flippase GtrA
LNEETVIGALWERYRSLILYGLIGLTGAFLDMAIFIVLTTRFGLYYQLSNLLSVTIGITNNFFWNARFNFKRWDRLFLRFASFYIIGIVGLLISAGLLLLLIGFLHLPTVLSKAMTFVFVALSQFVLNKRISFRNIRENAE